MNLPSCCFPQLNTQAQNKCRLHSFVECVSLQSDFDLWLYQLCFGLTRPPWSVGCYYHDSVVPHCPVCCFVVWTDTMLSLTRSNYGGIMAVSHQNYEGSWLSVTRTMRDHGCQSPELWGIMAVNHQNCEGSWLSVTRPVRDHGYQSLELWGIMAVNHQNYDGLWMSITRTMRDHGYQSPELWGIMDVNHQNYEGSWLSITRTMRGYGCQSPNDENTTSSIVRESLHEGHEGHESRQICSRTEE